MGETIGQALGFAIQVVKWLLKEGGSICWILTKNILEYTAWNLQAGSIAFQ